MEATELFLWTPPTIMENSPFFRSIRIEENPLLLRSFWKQGGIFHGIDLMRVLYVCQRLPCRKQSLHFASRKENIKKSNAEGRRGLWQERNWWNYTGDLLLSLRRSLKLTLALPYPVCFRYSPRPISPCIHVFSVSSGSHDLVYIILNATH